MAKHIVLTFLIALGCACAFPGCGRTTNEVHSMASTIRAGDEELVAWNAKEIARYIGISSDSALTGASQHLYECGCGRISAVDVTDHEGNTFTLAVTDESGSTYILVVDDQGYLGTITDADGNFLYAPVE